ncbi:MAG: RDD family protein [Thermoleophilaceae bacterium]|nr:RDD family protein [Thermoleophilaceae bacterium]
MEVSPSAEAEREFASWGRRLVALLVDGAILGVIVLVTLLAAGVPAEDVNATILEGSSLALILLFVLPKAIYDTAMIGSRNQTFGKMALGIKVVDENDRATPIGYVRAFTRWLSAAFLWALFTVPGILDHLWPLRDRRRQTFHDKLARSVVVRT